MERLQGNGARVSQVACAIHDRHPTPADFGLDDVTAGERIVESSNLVQRRVETPFVEFHVEQLSHGIRAFSVATRRRCVGASEYVGACASDVSGGDDVHYMIGEGPNG